MCAIQFLTKATMSHQQAHEDFELSSSKHMWTQSAGASKDACI